MELGLASSVARRLKRVFYVLFGLVVALFMAWAFMARTLPYLELWHTVELESEFRAADAARIHTIEGYKTLENRLFEKFDRKGCSGQYISPC